MSSIPSSAIVIGAGFSGMASALILAGRGIRVTLVEQAALPGITLRGFVRKGVYFDSGFHFAGELSERGILRAYLRHLGLDDLPYADFDSEVFETVRFSDGSSISLPVGYEAVTEALCAAFPHERRGIAAYMREVRAAYFSTPFHTFSGTRDDWGESNPRWQISLEAMLDKYVTDPRLRTALTISGWLYGVSPREAPFLLHARVAGSHFDSVRTFRGGGRTLVKACERRLAETGVTLLCGSAVKRILLSSAALVEGVELENGERIRGEAVVYTGHPAGLPDMLPENVFKPAFRNRLRLLKDCISAHLLFLAATDCPEALRGRNLLICPHDEPFAAAFEPGRRPQQGPFYVLPAPSSQTVRTTAARVDNNADVCGKTERPITAVVAFALSDQEEYSRFYGTRQGSRPQEYKELKEERLSRFAEALFTACPDLSGLDILDGTTPLTLHDWLRAPGGGLYGAAHNLFQFNPLPVTRVPNIYLAGQAVTAPGLMGAAISAYLACGCIVGRETLLNEVRSCKQDV